MVAGHTGFSTVHQKSHNENYDFTTTHYTNLTYTKTHYKHVT